MQTKRQDITLFAERLRVERTRQRMSQADIAQIGGVSKTSQVAYEAGTSYPDADYLSRLAESGIDVQLLLTGRRNLEHDWDLAGC